MCVCVWETLRARGGDDDGWSARAAALVRTAGRRENRGEGEKKNGRRVRRRARRHNAFGRVQDEEDTQSGRARYLTYRLVFCTRATRTADGPEPSTDDVDAPSQSSLVQRAERCFVRVRRTRACENIVP